MKEYLFEKVIKNKNKTLNVVFKGTQNINKISYFEVNYLFNIYLENIDLDKDYIKIIRDIRTIFKDLDENELILNYNKGGKDYYKIYYKDKELIRYENKENSDDYISNFIFNKNGILYNINPKNINEINTNVYLNRIKELNALSNIVGNELTNEMLFITKIYRLFYNEYPNYNSKNIYTRINSLIFLLKEYGVKIPYNYKFSNNNPNKIPMCDYLNDLIDFCKTFSYLDTQNIEIDKKSIETINIIRDSIKESKTKEIKLKNAVLYLSIFLYAIKYILKLGYTLEDVVDNLNCPKTIAENGLRLYKNVNKKN